MTRTQWAVALMLMVGLVAWNLTRSGRTVNAAESPAVYSYGENTQEVALERWASGAPRHWRTLVVKR